MVDPRVAKVAAVATAVLSVLLLVAFASQAQAYVYWTNANGTIGRANLDGTGVNQAFITGPTGPFAIAVDATHVYWADQDANAIGRANIDGTNVDEDFISTVFPQGVAVDGSHVYWTTSPVGPDAIGRANLDGSGVDQDYVPTDEAAFGVAVNASHIYWANYSSEAIGRANLDGTGATQSLIASPGDSPQGIAVDGGHVYWSAYEQNGARIARANLDGSDRDLNFIPGLSNPYGIAANASNLFYVDRDLDAVSRAALDGSAVTASFIGGADAPYGVAVDGLPRPPAPPPPSDSTPPETSITKAPKNKSDKPRARYRFDASEPNSTFECKLKGKRIKRALKRFGDCDSPRKYKGLDEGKFRFAVRATDPAGNVDPSPAKDRFKVVD